MNQIIRSNVTSFRDMLTSIAVTDKVTVSGGMLLNNDDGSWSVATGGTTIPALWLDSIDPTDGQQSIIAIVTPAGGQSYAVVLGGVSDTPNLGESCTVLTVSALTCSVSFNGITQTAFRLSCYTPIANDVAFVVWRGQVPYLVGAITTATVTSSNPTPTPVKPAPIVKPAPAPPPPPPKIYGTNNYSCTNSGTWSQGYNWNSYYGSKVYSGSGYVPPSRGTWFYNGATKSLANRPVIKRVQFYLGTRQAAGSYNSIVQVHFYVSSDNYKGGQPNLISSVYNLNVAPGFPGGWIDLPVSFGTLLKSGGSITISGDPYVGFMAGSAQPASGALKIDWST